MDQDRIGTVLHLEATELVNRPLCNDIVEVALHQIVVLDDGIVKHFQYTGAAHIPQNGGRQHAHRKWYTNPGICKGEAMAVTGNSRLDPQTTDM